MMILQSPYATPVSALVYPSPDWSFSAAAASAVSKFSDGVDRNRLYATGSTASYHTVARTYTVTPGATHRLSVYLQADTTTKMGFEYYNNGAYAGGHDVDLSTGAVTVYTFPTPTVTDLGGGVYKLEFDYVIPAGVTSLEIRHLIYKSDGTASYIPNDDGYFASATTFPQTVAAPTATDSTIAVTGQFPAYGVHKLSRHGPFEHNGNLYVLLAEKGSAGTATNLNVYKSIDGGVTWAGTNVLTNHSGQAISAMQSGFYIYFSFTNSNNQNGARRYNMSTDALESLPSPANACNADLTGNRALAFAVRSNGHYVFGRQGSLAAVSGTNYRRAVLDYRNQTTATTTNSISLDNLGTTAAHGDVRDVYTDADDRVWCFYTRSDFPNRLYCRVIEPGATTLNAAEHVVAIDVEATAKYAVGATSEYVSGSVRYVVLSYRSSATGNPLRYVRISSSTTPGFASADISSNAPESTVSNPGVLVENGSNLLHSVQTRALDNDLYAAAQSSIGGAFGTPSSQIVGTINGISAELIGTKVGIVYSDGGTVKFRSYSV